MSESEEKGAKECSSSRGPCVLCDMQSEKYKYFNTLPDRAQTLILHHSPEGAVYKEDAYICYRCAKQTERNMLNSDFQPRWLPKNQKKDKPCSVEGCKEKSHCKTNLITPSKLEQLLGKRVVAFTVTENDMSLVLCRDHYSCMYTKLHTKQTCSSCGERAKRGEIINRKFPASGIVNEYLNRLTNETQIMTEDSTVCLSCYKYFHTISKELAKNDIHKSGRQDEMNIECIISNLEKQTQSLRDKVSENFNITDYMLWISCICAKNLAEYLNNDEALLLSTIYQDFTKEVKRNISIISSHLTPSTQEFKIPGKRWLLARFHTFFGPKLETHCKHYRYGSLVMLRNCDHIKAISSLLGRQHTSTDSNQSHAANTIPKHQPSATTDIEEKIEAVSAYLNKRMHQQAQQLIVNYKESPHKYPTLKLKDFADSLDPVLLNFVKRITQPVRSRKRSLFQDIDSDSLNTRNIRQMYSLCVLLFCTNSTCSMPIHVLLTETILCHGESLELVRIMNSVGAAACADTANRLSTQVVRHRIINSIHTELYPNTLTVVTIDNIDKAQPFAMVASTADTRSWHGTSVMSAQPRPLSLFYNRNAYLETTAGHTGSRKRPNSSPIASPMPTLKRKHRSRTLTENASSHAYITLPSEVRPPEGLEELEIDLDEYPHLSGTRPQLSQFTLNCVEKESLEKLQKNIYQAIILKNYDSSRHCSVLPGLQSFLNCVEKQTDESDVSAYIEIRSERADSKATLSKVLAKLHKIFIVEQGQKWVVVAGDAKTFDLLQSMRIEYGNHLKWLIILPGDWHILFNYQKAVMKVFADAGLVHLGKLSGHRAETLTSLIQCSNFRRTHRFLLQVYQALYQFFIKLHMKKTLDSSQTNTTEAILSGILDQFVIITDDSQLPGFREILPDQLSSLPFSYQSFKAFISDLAKKQDTVKFWYHFITEDCFSYIALFLGIRYRNWQLRTGGLKMMAAIFEAFDRSIYQRLVPQHLKDLTSIPECILEQLVSGSFSVRLSSSQSHALALDECHETTINKDAKLAALFPTESKMVHISNYLQFRANCINNLKREVFSEQKPPRFSHRPTSKEKTGDTNIKAMLEGLHKHGMFTECEENCGLWNIFTNEQATPEQAHDMLHYREIGQEGFETYVSTRILRQTSTTAPIRRKHLCTFTVTKRERQKVKQIDRERKLTQRFLKCHIARLISNPGQDIGDTEMLCGPISTIPRAITDSNGLPYKAAKNTVTNYLKKRYSTVPVVLEALPANWIPDSVILEGMFMIQTPPLSSMETMESYTKLMLQKYVRPHLHAGAKEIHIIFDSPGALPETPKEIEHFRRDQSAECTEHHECFAIFQTSSPTPQNWRATLDCRRCKQNLVTYLASELLTLIPPYLRGMQTVVTNIGMHAYRVTANGNQTQDSTLTSNADEADLRVWLHCQHSFGTKKLIFSPDTDIYHIGLTTAQTMPNTDIIIQLSKSPTESAKFLHLNGLFQALATDPDLATTIGASRPQMLQTLYVCTGCDYTSFFRGIGKISFLNTFFQHAKFIASCN